MTRGVGLGSKRRSERGSERNLRTGSSSEEDFFARLVFSAAMAAQALSDARPGRKRPRYPSANLLGRIATYVVPILAVGVTAAVLLGPGATRKAAFVRVYGTPLVGATSLALRIEGAERLYGVDEKAALQALTIEATDHGTALDAVHISLGPDGVGEAVLAPAKPLLGPCELLVRRGTYVLGRGELNLSPSLDMKRAILSPLHVPGQTSGNLEIHVAVRRGSLAAPFDDVLDLWVGLAPHVSPMKEGFDNIALEASAPGAVIQPEKFVTDEQGKASIVITPQAHHIELTITGHHAGHGDGKWVGTLPVIPGAIWMKPDTKGSLEFVSPVPRERLYVSAMEETGRLFGAVVPVSPDEQQIYRGKLDLPEAIKNAATYVVVAGDPQEQGTGTVAWPLRASEEVEPSRVAFERVLDGSQAAEAYERGRASRVRRLALLVVIASTVFEVLYMLTKSRQSQKSFEEGLMRFAESEVSAEGTEAEPLEKRREVLASARQENPVLRVALAISLVLVAFSMIGALSTLQW